MKIVIYGFGSIGSLVAKTILEQKRYKIIGAVDVKNVGTDIGLILGTKRLGIKILPKAVKTDLAIHTTSSRLREIKEQIFECLDAGCHVISTAEELVYPWERNRALAKQIDVKAKSTERVVLGIGVNPGFVLDCLPIFMAKAVVDVQSIFCLRSVDVVKRRQALQKKVGMGMTRKEWEHNFKLGKMGHVGLLESADMIAHCMGWKLKMKREIKPVLKDGIVLGQSETVEGFENKKKRLRLELNMYGGAEDFDTIEIEGRPVIRIRTNGISGDIATVARVLNAIPSIKNLSPGLKTPLDLNLYG
jgi:4-hydroxy-tetrahydrodipicolinate reductase